MINGLWEIALGVIGLSLVVLVHEAGHFFAARFTGVRVETFSIGFGRRLTGFRRGDTDYRLSLVPLGGYCRFSGEQSFRRALDEDMDRIPSEQGDYYGAGPGRRIAIALAGPAANLIFAVLVFTAIAWIGYQEHYTDPRIILASDYSDERAVWPADEAGLRSGDVIVEVQGETIDRFQALRQRLVFRPNESLDIVVERDGRRIGLEITPELDRDSGVAVIGVLNWMDPVIAEIRPGGMAESAGLLPGDRIVGFDGTATPHTVALFHTMEDRGSHPGLLEVERNGVHLSLPLPGDAAEEWDATFQARTGRSERLNGFQAISRGFVETFETLSSTVRGLRMLFMGIRFQNAVSGPVRLITDTGSVVAEGFRTGFGPGLLWSFELMALISVSLAFLNLLPIPVLDGGQILLFVVEFIRTKPIHPRSVYRYQFVGTIIVLAIAIAATTGDVLHFNGR